MTEEGIAQQRKTARKVFLLIAGLFIIAIIIGGFYFSKQSSETIARMRDISIILLALVFLLIGAALVILIAQMAVLTTLVQNKVEPIFKFYERHCEYRAQFHRIYIQTCSRTDNNHQQHYGWFKKDV